LKKTVLWLKVLPGSYSCYRRGRQEEVLTRFCVKQLIIENSALYIVHSKPWLAQKIADVLGEI
jgi:hypothetical protein